MECIAPEGKREVWICLDDVWADNDWRSKGRTVTVIGMDGPKVRVRSNTDRESSIRPDRMRPTSTGFRLERKVCDRHATMRIHRLNPTTHTLQGPRDYQEDRVLLGSDLIALSDGMGGHAHGDLAAEAAISALAPVRPPTTEQEMVDLIKAAGKAVREIEAESWRRPGCTLVVAALVGTQVIIGWCGDSRAYVNDEQVTTDHGDGGSVLYRALGAGMITEPDVVTLDVTPGDRVILVSDGISDILPTERITQVADARELVNMGRSRGLTDNATAVVAKVVAA